MYTEFEKLFFCIINTLANKTGKLVTPVNWITDSCQKDWFVSGST